jgi:ketosteroid isomerase-like protein
MNVHGHSGFLVFLGGLVLSSSVLAHESTATTSAKPAFVQDIAPAAIGAVQVVDAFSAAIKAGKLDVAKGFLDPAVLILESGGAERSRDEYMSSHAPADAAFMKSAHQQILHRRAEDSGDSAWVATESLLQAKEHGKPLRLMSTETMVLKKSARGWKIVHIHWSSRKAPS